MNSLNEVRRIERTIIGPGISMDMVERDLYSVRRYLAAATATVMVERSSSDVWRWLMRWRTDSSVADCSIEVSFRHILVDPVLELTFLVLDCCFAIVS